MNDDLLRLRVERGAEHLDLDFPGWEDRIDTETLDLTGGRECILGQLFGGFRDGLDTLGLSLSVSRALGLNYEHQPAGWLGPLPGSREAEHDEAERLRVLWLQVIRLRRDDGWMGS